MKQNLHPTAKKHGYKSNADFYKDYPTPESYVAKYGKGSIVKPINNINPSASVIKNRALRNNGMYALGDEVLQTDENTKRSNAWGIAGMASGIVGTAANLLPTNEVDGQQFKSTSSTVLGGIGKGAAAGAAFGPWGMALGGIAGGVGAAFTAAGDRKAESEARTAYNTRLSTQVDPTQQYVAQGGQIGATQVVEVENNELRLKRSGNGWVMVNDYDGKSHAQGGIKTRAQEGDMIVRKDLAEKAKNFIASNNQVGLDSLLRRQHADKEKAEYKDYRQFVKHGGQIIKMYAHGDPVEITGLTSQYNPWNFGQQAVPNYMPQAPVQNGYTQPNFYGGEPANPYAGIGTAIQDPNMMFEDNGFVPNVIDPNASAPPPMMHQRLGLNENNVPTIPIQNRQSYNVSNPVTNLQPGGATYEQRKQESVNNAPMLKTLTPPESPTRERQKIDPTNLLAYGASAYNIGMGLSKAEQIKPNYANYGAAKSKLAERKYDISSILAQNRTNASTQAYNLRNSGNIGGGEYRAGLTQMQEAKSAADRIAYEQQSNVNNQYKAEEANLFARESENKQGAENMGRAETNANRVAKQNFMSTGLSQIQQTALNQKFMKQNKNMDTLRASMLKEIYPQFNGKNYGETWAFLKKEGYTDEAINELMKQ